MYRLMMTVALAFGMLFAPAAAMSAEFPDKTIHLISHSKPGGGMDIILRHLGRALEKKMPVAVVIENRPGAGAAVAMSYVATSRNPGYTIAGVTNTHIMTSLTNNPPHGIKDLRAVCKLVTDPLVLFASSKSKWNSVKELLDDVKAHPNTYSIAASQVGSVEYLLAYNMIKQGNKMQLIPFEAGGELATAVMGGHVDIGLSEPSEVMGQVTAGNLKVLCTFTNKRLASMPDVPTAEEVGLASDMQKVRVLMVPKKTPDAVVAYLEAACKDAMDDPDFKNFYQSNDMIADFKGAKDADAELNAIAASMAEQLTSLGLIKK